MNGIGASATIFTAVAARYGESDVIHIQISERRILDAYVKLMDEEDFVRVNFEEAPRWTFSGILHS